jgi:hypothetical protein
LEEKLKISNEKEKARTDLENLESNIIEDCIY